MLTTIPLPSVVIASAFLLRCFRVRSSISGRTAIRFHSKLMSGSAKLQSPEMGRRCWAASKVEMTKKLVRHSGALVAR